MANIRSCNKHNMIACVEKTAQNADFYQIIDFLTGCSINYSLLVDPDLIGPWLQQFWATATLKVINDVPHIRAKVAGKKILISEATIRADLLFDDENGVDCFPKQVIWDTLRDIGYEGNLAQLSGEGDYTLDTIMLEVVQLWRRRKQSTSPPSRAARKLGTQEAKLFPQAKLILKLQAKLKKLSQIRPAMANIMHFGAQGSREDTTTISLMITADQDAASYPDFGKKRDGTEEKLILRRKNQRLEQSWSIHLNLNKPTQGTDTQEKEDVEGKRCTKLSRKRKATITEEHPSKKPKLSTPNLLIHLMESISSFTEQIITQGLDTLLEILHVLDRQDLYRPTSMTTSVGNNSVFRSFFEKQKLTGPNFIDRQLRLVLSTEDKENYFEHPIPAAPVAQPGQQVPPEALAAHAAWVKWQKEVADLDIQRNLAHLGAYDMLQELKAMFSKQAEQELLQSERIPHLQEGGRSIC
ncbi:hypothetical protein Tco_0280594 [Tanacetum coccineum]